MKETILKLFQFERNVLSSKTVSENFPKEFGIYDLNEFLNVLTLVDKPHLTFEDDFVTVGDQTGRSGLSIITVTMLASSNKDVTISDGSHICLR